VAAGATQAFSHERHSLVAVAGERIQIGGQPEPARAFGRVRLPILYPHLPQHAYLEGSVLTVEDKRGQARQCDLGSAAEITLKTAYTIGRGWSFRVLYSRQAPGTPPVRLVLEGPDWFLVSAQHLRLLAQIISSRPGDPGKKARKAAQRLRDMASCQDYQNRPVDWSFRTAPKGRNRSSG
jgi:hypothetical protein